jgi:hypothetical protein
MEIHSALFALKRIFPNSNELRNAIEEQRVDLKDKEELIVHLEAFIASLKAPTEEKEKSPQEVIDSVRGKFT